jgi:hypothetical protein
VDSAWNWAHRLLLLRHRFVVSLCPPHNVLWAQFLVLGLSADVKMYNGSFATPPRKPLRLFMGCRNLSTRVNYGRFDSPVLGSIRADGGVEIGDYKCRVPLKCVHRFPVTIKESTFRVTAYERCMNFGAACISSLESEPSQSEITNHPQFNVSIVQISPIHVINTCIIPDLDETNRKDITAGITNMTR